MPQHVDIQNELHAIHQALSVLSSPDSKKIDNAMSEALDELKKSPPDRDEVGKALERALGYAKKCDDFINVMGKIEPCVKNAAIWLG